MLAHETPMLPARRVKKEPCKYLKNIFFFVENKSSSADDRNRLIYVQVSP